MIGAPSRTRSASLGAYPLEDMPRDARLLRVEAERSAGNAPPRTPHGASSMAQAALRYQNIFLPLRTPTPAAQQAPVPDDLQRRAIDLKGGACFLDASQVGICAIPPNAWYAGQALPGHSHALVLLVEFGRLPEGDNLAAGWLAKAEVATMMTRAAEIATIVAGYIASLGFRAQAHWGEHSELDVERLAVLAGIVVRDGAGATHAFVGRRFVLAAVSTDYAAATDVPLRQGARKPGGLRYLLGLSGAVSGLERWRRARRPSHLGMYPMETVKRVSRPTTLIFDDEIPRIPQRALFYNRGEYGDLGQKMVDERWRWAYKHPFAQGIVPLLRAMVPHQDGPIAASRAEGTDDAAANTRAIKSLAHYLGGSLTGICEIPRWAWYSHGRDGSASEPYHRYAVCILIDQGRETFEGACGDDWISGSQSMRAYMRGGEIAGLMATHIRQLGHAARPQTNVDSDVIHNPLLVLAGLVEQSRIGEATLNPFIGPRFKSVILSTDLPLLVDRPIDFGLQTFCSHCTKCARECPCNAIPFGEKIIWNGYETWKPDSERCTRYRFTNLKGSACGRCIKVCPLTKDTTVDGPLLVQLGSWLGVNVMGLKTVLAPFAAWLDDRLGYGNPNPAKKWWLDLEVVGGVSVTPGKGANFRHIKIARDISGRKAKETIAYYPASVLPPPADFSAHPVDRKAAIAMASQMEKPAQALQRRQRGEPAPAHYHCPWDRDKAKTAQ